MTNIRIWVLTVYSGEKFWEKEDFSFERIDYLAYFRNSL